MIHPANLESDRSKDSMWLLHSIQKRKNIFWLDLIYELKNTSDMPKLHTSLRLHVSDYKISGTTSAGPVVDQTCILKQ